MNKKSVFPIINTTGYWIMILISNNIISDINSRRINNYGIIIISNSIYFYIISDNVGVVSMQFKRACISAYFIKRDKTVCWQRMNNNRKANHFFTITGG